MLEVNSFSEIDVKRVLREIDEISVHQIVPNLLANLRLIKCHHQKRFFGS
jgi:hypothetical protein